ncbi:MAG: hypothetical protein GY805_07945 [Chloroflexi bacterium]|nr:hypothetical protein [Chloroflexota bacterium]
MNNILLGILVIVLLAIIEQLVAWILKKIIPSDSPLQHLAALIIAVIILSLLVVSLQSCSEPLPLSPTSTPQSDLLYQLTVQDNVSLDGVEGAEITLTVPGVVPFRAITDVDGLATVVLPEDVMDKTAVLTITTDNYRPYRLNVAVNLSQLPDLIRLEAPSP